MLSVRAPVGALNMATQKCCIGRGVAAFHGKYPAFVYYLLRSLQPAFDIYNNSGTTFGAINKDNVSDIKIILPPIKNQEYFQKIIASTEATIKNNYKQSLQLISLRDFLLPLLMNGQITIKSS